MAQKPTTPALAVVGARSPEAAETLPTVVVVVAGAAWLAATRYGAVVVVAVVVHPTRQEVHPSTVAPVVLGPRLALLAMAPHQAAAVVEPAPALAGMVRAANCVCGG